MTKISTIFAGLAVAILGGLALMPSASAADVTLTTSDNIQNAIAAADNGDTIYLSAGTYDVAAAVTIESGKSVNLVGQGSVTINLTSAAPGRVLKIYDTSNVNVSNINLTTNATGNNPPTWGGDMGVDISNACNVTLSNVSISNVGKFGIEVTASQLGTETNCTSTDSVTFNNITVTNSTGGIAFYDTNSSGSVTEPLTNISFTGTTTITGTNYGIDLNDGSGVASITSPNSLELNLGTLVTSNVTTPIITNAADKVALNDDSVINGTALSTLTAADLETLLGLPTGSITINSTAAPIEPAKPAPSVPNTGVAQSNLMLNIVIIATILFTLAIGTAGILKLSRERS
ncbi:MAG: glycoside hydrolase family 55 protein [Candidatus Nomurabacteria bacterium]|jgi:hypothetical protein|nr:glycoside hydrolase family 55 protein [Candidatus Nomurabacteria bacterium]